jgi:Arf-GAP with coiled-coil, ANK repeat and PH domain-containing protein
VPLFSFDGVQSESLQVTLLRFANAMEEVEEYRNVLFMQLDSSVTQPLTEQLKRDSRCARETLRRTQKARETYESAVARVCQQKRGREDATVMRDLQESRCAYQRETVDTVCELNELQAERKIDCLERVCSFLYAQASFYHQAHHLFEELQPYMRAISSDLQATRVRFDQDRREMRARAAQIKLCEGRPAPLDPSATEVCVC